MEQHKWISSFFLSQKNNVLHLSNLINEFICLIGFLELAQNEHYCQNEAIPKTKEI